MTFISKAFVRFFWIFILLLAACDQADRTAPEVSLEPDKSLVDYNGEFELTWSAEGTDYCIASGDWVGNVRRSGSRTMGPLQRDSEYVLDCYHSGKLIRQTLSIRVGEPQVPDVRLAASPLYIAYNGKTNLTWAGRNVTDCRASGDWSGSREAQGSVKVDGLRTDSEFRLVCQGARGAVTAGVKVKVYEAGIDVPFVSIRANPLQVPYRGSTTLSWKSSGADICRASGDWGGSKNRTGTEIIRQLNQDSQFILTCAPAAGRGVAGRDAAEVRISNPPPSARPSP